MLSLSKIPKPRFKLWQRIVVDERPAIITGCYYLPPITALKLNTDCCGWQYAVDYLEAMSANDAIASFGADPMEFVDESYLVEAMEVKNASTHADR